MHNDMCTCVNVCVCVVCKYVGFRFDDKPQSVRALKQLCSNRFRAKTFNTHNARVLAPLTFYVRLPVVLFAVKCGVVVLGTLRLAEIFVRIGTALCACVCVCVIVSIIGSKVWLHGVSYLFVADAMPFVDANAHGTGAPSVGQFGCGRIGGGVGVQPNAINQHQPTRMV